MLGYDVMRTGIQAYFKKYQWDHATFSDLVACLEEAQCLHSQVRKPIAAENTAKIYVSKRAAPKKVAKKKKKAAKKGAKKPVKCTEAVKPGFKLADWCNSWVRCSGINTLEAILERGVGGKLLSLKIKQTCSESGSTNRLRL